MNCLVCLLRKNKGTPQKYIFVALPSILTELSPFMKQLCYLEFIISPYICNVGYEM